MGGAAEEPETREQRSIVDGIARRLKIPLRENQRNHRAVALVVFLSGSLSIAILATLAAATRSPFIFPSLGPTAFLCFTSPLAPSSSPRNTIVGHFIGVAAGYFSLVVTGLTEAGPGIHDVTWPRVIAVALSVGLASGFMLLAGASHAPSGATTLIVSLGILTSPWELLVLMLGVVVLVVVAIAINRLTGIPYPLWRSEALDAMKQK